MKWGCLDPWNLYSRCCLFVGDGVHKKKPLPLCKPETRLWREALFHYSIVKSPEFPVHAAATLRPKGQWRELRLFTSQCWQMALYCTGELYDQSTTHRPHPSQLFAQVSSVSEHSSCGDLGVLNLNVHSSHLHVHYHHRHLHHNKNHRRHCQMLGPRMFKSHSSPCKLFFPSLSKLLCSMLIVITARNFGLRLRQRQRIFSEFIKSPSPKFEKSSKI